MRAAASSWSTQRQLNGNAETGIQILRANRTAMFLDRFPRDRKAEAGTARLRGEVRIEDLRQHLHGDAGAAVLDAHQHLRVDGLAAEADFAAGRGLEGVLDQVR